MDSERDHAMAGTDESFVDALDVPDLPDLDGADPLAPVDAAASNGSHPADPSDPGDHELVSADPLADEAADDVPEAWRVTRLSYGRHLRVLLVESDTDRADAFTRAAIESVLDVAVEPADGVDEALSRLERSTGALLRRPMPDVAVVGVDMPEAHRLLEILRSDTRFDSLPVIVLAETASPEAERRSFALGATAHLVAPRRDYERVALIHALPDFIPRARAVHASLEHRR
ncbi:MAG: hypothetical protein U5K29_04165 [Acidimicrobiales bacterium]|nr:hypothetical protein [Acidimicrobiales bacterium]